MSGAKRSKTPVASAKIAPPSPEPAVEATGGASRAMGCLRAVALWLLIVVVYAPTFSSGFIWDDDDYVTRNPMLTSVDGLKRIWIDPSATPQYYPLVHTTFWVEYQLWGLDATGYHVVNVLLHATATVLLGVVLQRLAIPGAWLAALIFGLHPVHVETVAWVTERKNVLSAVFYLLAALQFVRVFRLDGDAEENAAVPRTWIGWGAGVALFLAALLSKSVTCSLPAVIVLLILWRRRRITVREIALLAPLFVLGGLMAWNTATLERSHVGASGATFEWTPSQRFLIAGRALWTYAGLLLVPVRLNFNYPRWIIDAGSAWQWMAAGAAFVTPLVVWLVDRRMSGRLLALLFFGGTLLPALGFFNIYPMRYSYVADHFQYLASSGLIALAAGWWTTNSLRQSSPGARWALRAAQAVVLIVLAGLTIQRQFVFRSPAALWDDTLAKNPTSMMAHAQRAYTAKLSGDHLLAAEHFQKALEIRTDDDDAPNLRADLALALMRLNRLDEAEREYRQALKERPTEFAAANGLATLLAKQGRLEEAIRLFRSASDQQPTNAVVLVNLGNALATAGDLPEAEGAYRRAVELDSLNAGTLIELAKVLARQKRFAEAEESCRRALAVEPGSLAAGQLLQKIRADASR